MTRTRIDDQLLSFLRTNSEGAGTIEEGELSSVDWEDLLQKSARHHVTPLLYHRMKTVHPDVPVPPNVMQKLRNTYLHSAGKNIRLYQELGKVLGRFREHGIPVIALKGAHLASAVYRNVALRPMADVDLLVNKCDLLKVQEIMVELGYTASREEIFSAHEQLPAYRKKNSVCIEIHFNITEPPFSCRVDVGNLFARAKSVLIDGNEVLALCPEDLLLHLCMHASYHHGFDNGILPLFDIATVLECYKEDLDLEQVFRRSREWGVEKCVSLTLSLAEIIAGVSIPDRFRVDAGFHRDDFGAIIVAEEFLFGKGTKIMPNMARLFGDDRLREKAIHFMRRAFPPKDVMLGMNQDKKHSLSMYLLYFYRIKGLFTRHGQTAWKIFLRYKEMSAFAAVENRRNVLKDWLKQGT